MSGTTAPTSSSSIPAVAFTANIKNAEARALLFTRLDTLKDCIGAIPEAYRARIKPVLTGLADRTQRVCSLIKTVRTLEHHVSQKTFPPQLEAVHQPVFQVSKQFQESKSADNATTELAKLSSLWSSFREDYLTTVLALKIRERDFFSKSISSTEYKKEIDTALVKGFAAISKFFLPNDPVDLDFFAKNSSAKIPDQLHSIRNDTYDDPDDEELNVEVHRESLAVTATAREIYACRNDALAIAARVVHITMNKEMREVEKTLEKLNLQKQESMEIDSDMNSAKTLAMIKALYEDLESRKKNSKKTPRTAKNGAVSKPQPKNRKGKGKEKGKTQKSPSNTKPKGKKGK